MARSKKLPQARERYWVGYCRKSTDTEDKQVHSLRDQAAMIRDYYDRLPEQEKAGLPLRFMEEARSAYHPGRPVFGEILQMADRGQVRGVIVVHPNRVSRNHADSGAFVQRLVEGRVGCLDTAGGKRYTGADSNDIFMLTLEGAMSWKDSRDKGDRILQAMRMRAAEGKHMGPVRLGYRSSYQPDGTKVLEVVPAEAAVIRRIFDLAAAGTHSVKDLAAEAWRLGLRSRTGKRVTRSAVHAMLRDPIYKGDIRFDGVISRGIHEAVVDAAVWERVQDVLTERRTNTARPKDLELRDLFVFGSLLRCPNCRLALRPYRAKGRYVYYECKNPDVMCRVCVPQVALDGQLPRAVSGMFLTPDEMVRLREGLRERLRAVRSGSELRKEATASEYRAVQREIGEVFASRKEAQALGIADAVDLRLGELTRRRDDLRDRLEAAAGEDGGWVERVIRAFELASLLREAILFGSRQTREAGLRAVASNLTVNGKNLVVELKSPFREVVEGGGRPEWYSELYSVRTEIEDTARGMEAAVAAIGAAAPR